MSIQATNLESQRKHLATLWRNIRHHERSHSKTGCDEHAKLLRSTFAALLKLKLPRIPRHKP